MRLSANPKTKAEAVRWLRIGIELVVIDPTTDRPIAEKDGQVQVTNLGWTGIATLRNGLVIKLE